MTKKLWLIPLEDLEASYRECKLLILKTQRELIKSVSDSIKDITVNPSADFLKEIMDHTAQAPVNLELSKELQKQCKEFLKLENELIKRRKELFDNLDIDKINLLSLTSITNLLEKSKASNELEITNNTNLFDINQISYKTPIKDLRHYASTRLISSLRAGWFETFEDIVNFRKKEWPKEFTKFRNFGNRSLIELENLLRAHGDIE